MLTANVVQNVEAFMLGSYTLSLTISTFVTGLQVTIQKGKVLKAYAWPVFGLEAFDESENDELKRGVKETLVITDPHQDDGETAGDHQRNEPDVKEALAIAQPGPGSDEKAVAKALRKKARVLAEMEVWKAYSAMKKVGDQTFKAWFQLVTGELSMKYDESGNALGDAWPL